MKFIYDINFVTNITTVNISMEYKPSRGELVERHIEGLWFRARVEDVDYRNKVVRLLYVDDGNTETNVYFDEIRKSSDSENYSISIRETLQKPLAGLVDDDSEIRKLQTPRVILHTTSDVDEAIILNGAENKLAAGGGIKALRYLKT